MCIIYSIFIAKVINLFIAAPMCFGSLRYPVERVRVGDGDKDKDKDKKKEKKRVDCVLIFYLIFVLMIKSMTF